MQVISKGVMVYSGREPVTAPGISTVTTFSLPASTEMAPVAHILVWAVTQDGQVVAHAIAVPVNPLGRHEVSQTESVMLNVNIRLTNKCCL